LIKTSDIPILPTVRVSVPAGTQRIISFPTEFFGSAISIQIQNEDGTNTATYRYGGETQVLKNLPASSFRDIDNAIVNLLEINAGALGPVIVEAQVLLDPRSKIATPETVV